MKPTRITSRDNSLLRRARAARDGKDRDFIFIEGLRLSEEALKSGLQIEALIYSDEIVKKPRAAVVIDGLGKVATKAASVSEKLLESISYTKTPQGLVVLARRPAATAREFDARQPEAPLIVVMHGINNPVNVGAILRAAEAAGVTGVMTTTRTADALSPRSLRGAMGSAFRLPLWQEIAFAEAISWCREHQVRTFCAAVSGGDSYTSVDWRRPSALVLGPESTGLAREEIALTDGSVRIPMKGATESLNVAVAAGVILFEASRQR